MVVTRRQVVDALCGKILEEGLVMLYITGGEAEY